MTLVKIFAYLRAHWKTTIQGLLSFVVITGIFIQFQPLPVVPEWFKPWALDAAWFLGFAKFLLAIMQKDAGTVTAVVPGIPGVQSVPSHEIPDSPAAVPVVKP